MRGITLATALLCSLVSGACERSGPTEARPALLPGNGGGGVVASATGGGHVDLAFYDRAEPFSFNAVRHADGTVTGNWQLHITGLGTVSGDVVCLTIVGNQAWLGVTVERTDIEGVVIGPRAGIRVVDNGEGANDPPDLFATTPLDRVMDFPERFCRNLPNAPLRPIEAGNIQVRQR